MLVHWLTAAPNSTTINLVSRGATLRSDCHYLDIVNWIIIWVVERVDITFWNKSNNNEGVLTIQANHSLGVKSVVTCAEQQTTPRNPLAVEWEFELILTAMVPVLVKGPGMEGPRLSPSPL